jgi:hypothetical protein
MRKLAICLLLFCRPCFAQINACGQSGADAGSQITNAIAALPSTGGTVDARCYGATVQVISSQLNIGRFTGTSLTGPVTLLVDQSTRFNVSVTGGVPAIQIFNGSALECGGVGQIGGASTRGGFALTSIANVSSLIANGQQDRTQEYLRIHGCLFQGNNSATVTGPLAYFKLGPFVNSIVSDCVFLGEMSGTTVQIEGVSDVAWYNNWVNGAAGISGLTVTPMVINGTTLSVTIVGGAIEHSGGGKPLLSINSTTGSGAFPNSTRTISILGTGFETQSGGGNGIEITDAANIKISGLIFTGVTAGTDGIKIIESAAGNVKNVVLDSIDNLGKIFANTVNDTASGGEVRTDPMLAHYVHNGISVLSIVRAISQYQTKEGLPPAALAGSSVCYADSTLHAQECSFDSDSFSPLLRRSDARMTWGGFYSGPLTTNATIAEFVPDKAITVTGLTAAVRTAAVGCTTQPVVQVSDGTSSINLTITNRNNQNRVVVTQNYAANSNLLISLPTGAVGCTTLPSDMNVTVEYKMQ